MVIKQNIGASTVDKLQQLELITLTKGVISGCKVHVLYLKNTQFSQISLFTICP